MSPRNGKIKTKPTDSDDDFTSILKSRYSTQNRISNVQTIELESDFDDDDADYVDETYKPEDFVVDRRPTTSDDESEYSGESVNGLNMDLDLNLNVKPKSGSAVAENQLKAGKNRRMVKPKQRSRPIKLAPGRVIPTPIEGDEKCSFCCYLCGKTFQQFCRLRVHMPSHTNFRKFQCSFCDKRYKSSSSLNAHKKQCHFGKPSKPLPKLSSNKKSSQVATEKKVTIIPLPKIKHEEECKRIAEIKVQPIDFVDDKMDVTLELDPLDMGEHVPFVWDECDMDLILPMQPQWTQKVSLEISKPEQTDGKEDKIETAEAEAITSGDKNECSAIDILNVDDEVNLLQILTWPQVKPTAKLEIWQKETIDPMAMHVNILQMSNPKQVPFADKLDAPNDTAATHIAITGYNTKNSSLAQQFNAYGDTEFQQKNWADARQWYNRFLCHAEPNTYQFATAYAKRSQCYFNEGQYRTCWTDLMLAQSSGLPEAIMPQFERHKQLCELMVKRQQMQANQSAQTSASTSTAGIQPELSFAANPLFPEMVSAVQIDWNEYYGRHVRARQPIAVGSVLMIEMGFVASTTAFYEKCCICLTADINLVPCSRCTQALLCKNCVNGWFHQIECELQMSLDLNRHPWLAKVIRSFLLAINLFENVDQMMEFVDKSISNASSSMQSMIPIVNQQSKYRAFLQLITAPFIQAGMIPVLAHLHATLLNHPAIRSKFTSEKSHRFLAHLLVHHKCVIDSFTVKVSSAVCGNGFDEIVAPITSYLKHSCAPNVAKFLLGKSIILVAMRPIGTGEQLCVSLCNVMNAAIDRQNSMQLQYGFQCQCERCQSNISDQQQTQKTFHCDAAKEFVQQNFVYLASNDQIKRKQLTDCVVSILQQCGHMPWNYNIGWAYTVFSLLLSHRFQKKLRY